MAYNYNSKRLENSILTKDKYSIAKTVNSALRANLGNLGDRLITYKYKGDSNGLRDFQPRRPAQNR